MVSDKKKKNTDMPGFDLSKRPYRLIGWDIDTTGNRLGDEICQIAAYYPNAKYSQYILPEKDLNSFVEQRYKIRVITESNYRMLKDLKTKKMLKTKSELCAITDFITWLERNQGESNEGVILVYHEVKKIVPTIFLEALKRYNLFDRFASVVKGFCNTYLVAKIKCATTMKNFSLKALSRVLLDEEDDLNRSAALRANANYAIVEHIRQNDLDSDSDSEGIDDDAETQIHLSEFARQYSRSIDAEEKDLMNLKDFLVCLNSLRPVFKELMDLDWVSKLDVKRLRCKLAENNIHFNQLQNAWDNGGKKSIKQLLKTISTTKKKDYVDLLKILNCYFDPKKEPLDLNIFKQRKSNKNEGQEKAYNLRNSSDLFDDSGDDLPSQCSYRITYVD